MKKDCIHVGDFFPSMENTEQRGNIYLLKFAPQRIDFFLFRRKVTEQVSVFRARAELVYKFKNTPVRCGLKAPVWDSELNMVNDFPISYSGQEFINAICLEENTDNIAVMVGGRRIGTEDIVRFDFFADTFVGTFQEIFESED